MSTEQYRREDLIRSEPNDRQEWGCETDPLTGRQWCECGVKYFHPTTGEEIDPANIVPVSR